MMRKKEVKFDQKNLAWHGHSPLFFKKKHWKSNLIGPIELSFLTPHSWDFFTIQLENILSTQFFISLGTILMCHADLAGSAYSPVSF